VRVKLRRANSSATCGAGRAPVDKRPCHPRNWHSMVRELARRRISAAEWLGFGLLAAALLVLLVAHAVLALRYTY